MAMRKNDDGFWSSRNCFSVFLLSTLLFLCVNKDTEGQNEGSETICNMGRCSELNGVKGVEGKGTDETQEQQINKNA